MFCVHEVRNLLRASNFRTPARPAGFENFWLWSIGGNGSLPRHARSTPGSKTPIGRLGMSAGGQEERFDCQPMTSDLPDQRTFSEPAGMSQGDKLRHQLERGCAVLGGARALLLLTSASGAAPSSTREQQTGNEITASHSITSSARMSSEGGIVKPSALAVLKLMIRRNLLGCSTGISAGLAPFRISAT